MSVKSKGSKGPKAAGPKAGSKATANGTANGAARTTVLDVLRLIAGLTAKAKEVTIGAVVSAASKRGLSRVPAHVYTARAHTVPPLVVSRKVAEGDARVEYLSLTAAGRAAVKAATATAKEAK